MKRSTLRRVVWERAEGRCEYCHLREADEDYYSFHLEHVIAKQHEGGDDQANLAWACHYCNRHKGTNLSAIDPRTLKLVRLFNPRSDRWDTHFKMRGAMIVGLSAIGRATARLLRFNDPKRTALRSDT
jgi:5-methylcytosine-specific restriction endonuclease McrA